MARIKTKPTATTLLKNIFGKKRKNPKVPFDNKYSYRDKGRGKGREGVSCFKTIIIIWGKP